MAAPVLAIANRAEIAIRIARTASRQGWIPVALLGQADWGGFAERQVGQVYRLRNGAELDIDAVVEAAIMAGATALHPGYGFLSERAGLSNRCAEARITFIGPSPETLRLAGDKIRTREVAVQCNIPVVPASTALAPDDPDKWRKAADLVGYPVIAKVAGAGGGRGLRVAREAEELETAIRSALNEAGGSGAGTDIFLEHYLEGARHVEVQVAGDGQRTIVLGDRDCSLQRRHQKVVEEAPAPGLPAGLRNQIHAAAVQLAEAIALLNLATIEFLVEGDDQYFFMEINPRLQVEHTVTEEVTGLDLVALQLDLAIGGELPVPVAPHGHAIQARLYAEDPFNQFLPHPGRIHQLVFPDEMRILPARLRIDAGYASGDAVPGNYDPMIAKIIVHGETRKSAVDALAGALETIEVSGIATNRPWLLAAIENGSAFHANQHDLTTAATIQIEERPPEVADLFPLPGLISGNAIERGIGAWSATGPFRIVEPAIFTFHGDEAGGWQRSTSAHELVDGGAGRSVTDLEDGWEVVAPRGRWIVQIGPKPSASGASAALDGHIRAPMPGKLLDVAVASGQSVDEGDVVAVMEAMKIEIRLAAPFAGVVSTVSANPGDLVGLRQAIVTIEQAPRGLNAESDQE